MVSVATVNGSGSQSANLIIHRSLFRMGLPVSGKNLFPSNIAGLPTWFLIRVTEEGYNAPADEINISVLMNAETWDDDLKKLGKGSVVICNSDLGKKVERNDLIVYEIPCSSIARKVDSKLARLITNTVYVGALAEVIGLEQEAITDALSHQFNRKKKAIDLNLKAIDEGRKYIQENYKEEQPWKIERRDLTKNKMIIEGNQAGALGSLFGGVTFLSWYPITPSSSLAENLISYLKDTREYVDGVKTYAVVQAEDELAAAGMVFGAGWAGSRSMTTTSGAGISLMTEFIGLGYYAEIPGVFWNIQRVGPSTGLPTRTQQSDINFCYKLGHGDSTHPVLLPATPSECFEFGWKSFDVAERFQTPVFVLSDLDLGMNPWIVDDFEYPDKPLDRGKILKKEDLDKLESWGRYRDIDGDGIGYRTLPGTDHKNASYFTRGSGHDEDAKYTEDNEAYARNMKRLAKKHEGLREKLPQPVIEHSTGSEIGLVSFGTVHASMQETIDLLEKEKIKVDYLRIKSLPLSGKVHDFIRKHKKTFVIEQNRDAQMFSLIKEESTSENIKKLYSYAYSDGMPLSASKITQNIKEKI